MLPNVIAQSRVFIYMDMAIKSLMDWSSCVPQINQYSLWWHQGQGFDTMQSQNEEFRYKMLHHQ
jgi:hypothetical protein